MANCGQFIHCVTTKNNKSSRHHAVRVMRWWLFQHSVSCFHTMHSHSIGSRWSGDNKRNNIIWSRKLAKKARRSALGSREKMRRKIDLCISIMNRAAFGLLCAFPFCLPTTRRIHSHRARIEHYSIIITLHEHNTLIICYYWMRQRCLMHVAHPLIHCMLKNLSSASVYTTHVRNK